MLLIQIKVINLKNYMCKYLTLILSLFIIGIITNYSALAQNWQSIYDSTSAYYDKEDFKSAVHFGEQALKLAEKEFGRSHENYLQTITLLVDVYFSLGDNNKSFEYARLDSQITVNKYGVGHSQHIRCLANLGLLYYATGNLKESEVNLKFAYEYGKQLKVGRDSVVAFALTNLGLVYELKGQYDLTKMVYLESLDIQKKNMSENSPDYSTTLHNLATLYQKMGFYEEAEPLFQKSLDIERAKSGEEKLDYATGLANLASLYQYMGRYDDAEPLFKKSLNIRKKKLGEIHATYASNLIALGLLYQKMGRFENAEILYKEAIEIQKGTIGEKHSNFASSLNNLASLYEAMEKYSEAEPLYKRTLSLFKEIYGEKHAFYATSLDNLAVLYRRIKRYSEAEPLYLQALAIRRESLGENHPDYAKTMHNIADLYQTMNRYKEAEAFYIKAMDVRRKVLGDNHPDYAKTVNDLAVLYKNMNRNKEAEPLFIEALDKYIYQVKRYFPYLSEKEKQQFWTSVRSRFELFNSFAVQYSKTKPAILSQMYNYNLITKGLILSSTKKVLSKIRQSGDTTIIRLLDRWQSTRDFWLFLYNNPEEAKKKGIKIDSVAEVANDFEKQLASASDEFKKVFSAKSSTWKDVQTALRPKEAAVEIIRFRLNSKDWTDTVFYAALIITKDTKSNPILALIADGSDLEDKYIKLYGNLVKILRIQPIKSFTDFESKVLDEDIFNLYDHFWSKIQSELKGVKKIYLSLDGVYNSLNLMTLKNPKSKKFILEENDITIVTNTKDIIEYRQRLPLPNTFHADLFGNPKYNFDLLNDSDYVCCIPPLLATQKEIVNISTDLTKNKWSVDTFLGRETLEESVKAIKNPRLLHIATHGFFLKDVELDKGTQLGSETKDFENPLLRSMLIFAGAEKGDTAHSANSSNTDDGYLTAYEAMNLNLDNTDLVVLSACETGLGEVKNGEGVYGLQRAFQVAGTRSLIMSLWTVNDKATQMLMTKFYEKFIAGIDKKTAFRQAQLELKKVFPEFYYWGAFVMIGE
jgi:CHAT domain-containing protein/Tfp pilus assembly protein PilF